ncbi:MAG: ferritin-like domain-containing protein [Calditrichaeota bacterium]|nr:ferritin-like domain-containing protein [Calditrichota bacterium]
MILRTVNRWIEKLRKDEGGREAHQQEFIQKLQRNYNDEKILALELEAEAQLLPYDHLKQEVLEIARKEHEHAQKIAQLIRELGGEVDTRIESSYQAKPDGEFTQLLRVEKELGERLMEEANWAEDYGFLHHARVLRELDAEHHMNMENIERVIMRVNAIV